MRTSGSFKNVARALLSDESGQSTTEYVLLLVVVVFIVKQVKSTMSSKLQSLVNTAFSAAEQDAQSINGGP